MEEGDQKHRYITNLNATLRQEVLKTKPSSLEEAIHAAVNAEAYASPFRGRQHFNNWGRGAFPSAGGRSMASEGATSSTTPMDLNNINHEESTGNTEEQEEDYSAPKFWDESSGSTNTANTRETEVQRLLAIMENLNGGKVQQKVKQSILSMFGDRSSRRGATFVSKAKIPNVSKADYERCRRENRCINCKQPGHIARECTKPFSLKW